MYIIYVLYTGLNVLFTGINSLLFKRNSAEDILTFWSGQEDTNVSGMPSKPLIAVSDMINITFSSQSASCFGAGPPPYII